MQQGYVLLMMLVYMQIFSLLAMQAMADVVYQQQTARHRISNDQLRREALKVLADIDRVPAVSCRIEKMTTSQLASHDIQWLRSRGCYINRGEIQYFYVRETLGMDNCAVISNEYKQLVTPLYYRNTLLQLYGLNKQENVVLQDTVAIASLAPPVCSIKLKLVKSGRQMLRWM